MFSLAFFSTAVYHSSKLVHKKTKKRLSGAGGATHKTAHNCSSSLSNTQIFNHVKHVKLLQAKADAKF